MFRFLKNHTHAGVPILQRFAGTGSAFAAFRKCGLIGVDMGDDALKLVQLGNNGKGTNLIAGGSENRPENVKPGSSDWQRWAVEAIKRLTGNGKFRGRDVIAAMPASEVFIDHIKIPKINERFPNAKNHALSRTPFAKRVKGEPELDDKLRDVVFSKIKLPFDSANAMVKYIPTEDDNVLVIATERKKIDRHLAIYEKTNLQIKSMGIWPMALINSYTSFFGRRKADIEAVVLLLDIEPNCTNVVICRYSNLLFARSIPIGTKQLEESAECDKKCSGAETNETVTRLLLELTTCRRHFGSLYRKAQIERLIFLSGKTVDRDVCATIAKQLEMPAQMGDCLAAVEIANPSDPGIDRRGCKTNWATAFGLSLSLS